MKFQQCLIDKQNYFHLVKESNDFCSTDAQLILVFGERKLLEIQNPFSTVKQKYPNADIVLCSTSGQISTQGLIEEKVVVTAIAFEKTKLKAIEFDILNSSTIDDLGNIIKDQFYTDDLKSILILSEGSHVNGTELINELIKKTNSSIPIFGGLAGDEDKFEKTIVGLNHDAQPGKIVAVGFYGDNLHFGFGCDGGWNVFGPEREVTKSEKNVLYRIGDRFALDLYKEYLGKYAVDLPGASLYFPLSMRENKNSPSIVRTILSINEEEKSMTFAGNIPEGSIVRLMKGNFDKLIDASYKAAKNANEGFEKSPEIAFLVSCVGRRLLLGNRVEEELEVVNEVYGKNTLLFGFYSYGEISPKLDKVACELHNQTMTITTMYED